MGNSTKTIVAINECDFGSTGTIASSVLNYCEKQGMNSLLAVFRSVKKYDKEFIISGGKTINFLNRVLCRIDGSDGFRNHCATRKFIKELKKIKPSILHIHNIHGRYINLKLLFKYASKEQIPIIWTLHDCWSFTGRCAHFEIANCYKWKNRCGNCPSRKEYPASYVLDRTTSFLKKKSNLCASVKNLLTFVCPSKWLFNYLDESKNGAINKCVINNGIVEPPFFSEQHLEEVRKHYGIQGKHIFMFASSGYSPRKGLAFFNRLADELSSDEKVFIVVGIEEKFKDKCSSNVINIGVIRDRQKMNELFAISSAFINTTLEDNFPTVNLESLSNGTPVITFNTGGSPETIDSKTGIVVEKGNYDQLKTVVEQFDKTHFSQKDCIERGHLFACEKMCEKYYSLISKAIRIK